MKPTENEVHEACRKIISASNKTRAVDFAFGYAKVGLDMSGEALRVQCLYILNNISRWRSDEAKEVRRILKEFTKK